MTWNLSEYCLTRLQIDTTLPASEAAFQAGSPEPTSPLTSMVHLEGQNISDFAARVLAASYFHQAFQHSVRRPSDDDAVDVQTSLHWKTHRQIDNDLAMLLHCLPDGVKLPKNIRCHHAIFINILIHNAVICLHRAAVATMQKVGASESMMRQSDTRLIAAAEEILNMLRMVPDVGDMLKNPMLAFSLYTASLIFLEQPESDGPNYQRQENLDFTLRLLILAAKTWGNPVTRSMAIQLAADMRGKGLNSAAVEKVSKNYPLARSFKLSRFQATELQLERSTGPILGKPGDDSSNVLYQVHSSNVNGPVGNETDPLSIYDTDSYTSFTPRTHC